MVEIFSMLREIETESWELQRSNLIITNIFHNSYVTQFV